MEGKQRILVVGPSWVGDMVMAQALFALLKTRYSSCHLTVMAPAWTQELLGRMPEVDARLDSGFAHGELKIIERRRAGRSLRKHGFTLAIVLPNSFKSALMPYFARIPQRIGWRGEWRDLLLTDCRRLDKRLLPLMVQRFAALAFPEGSLPPENIPRPKLRVDPQTASEFRERLALTNSERILALCPGAEFGGAKQWPVEYYAELGNHFLRAGWQVLLLGSINDTLTTESILADIEAQNLPRIHNLAGQTSLGEAIDLLSLATAVVTNDSGLMHIAAALQKPIVALYGSTSPDFTPPLAQHVKSLHTDIACRPCFQRECPLGHRRCLTDLRVHRVLAAVHELLADIGQETN